MSVKVTIKQPGDGLKLVEAVRKFLGITIQKVHMEVKGKSIDLDFRKKPSVHHHEGGKP